MHCCLINLLNYYSNDIIPLLEIHSWLFTVYGNNQNFLTLVLTVCSHNSLSILISYYSPTFMSLFLFSSSQQDTCSPETPCTKPVYTSLSIHEWSLWHHSPVLFLISLKFYFSMNIFFFFILALYQMVSFSFKSSLSFGDVSWWSTTLCLGYLYYICFLTLEDSELVVCRT